MNPTPTDPREEKPKIVGYRSIAVWPRGEVNLGDPNNESDDSHGTEDQARTVCRLLEQNGFGGNGRIFPLSTRVEPIYSAPTESTNSKLAAEIAELKRGGRCECRFAEPPIEYHQGFKVEPGAGQMIWTNRCALHAVQVEKETATLRAELEAKQKVAFEAQNAAIAITAELEAARKELDRVYREFVSKDVLDTALAAKDAAERALDLEKRRVIGMQRTGEEMQAELDAAVAGLRDIDRAIAGFFWTSDDGKTLRDAEPDESGAPQWFIETWKGLRILIAALTPAPTQEPPAGGVTISTEKKERDHWKATAEFHYNARLELERERDRKGGDSSCAPSKEPTHQDSSKCASNSPADVRPGGRGEWMPIETAPRDGTYFLVGWFVDEVPDRERFTTIVAFYAQILGNQMLSVPGKYQIGPQATHWQPLPPPPMLPTEGSGA